MNAQRANPPAASAADKAAQVEAVLRQLESLPTLSPIATRVMSLSGSDDTGLDQIIPLIEADPSLSARMLSLCRRAGTGGAKNITTVRRAVVYLGIEALQSAVLSVQIYELFSQAPAAGERRDDQAEHAFDRAGFWRHSVGVACAAELLARQFKNLNTRPDEAFVAGLMHDLGVLALDWVLPKSFASAVTLASKRGAGLAAAERAVLGLDHHLVGKRIAERWGLPLMLQDVMWLHAQPVAAIPDSRHKPLVALVTLADLLCRSLHMGWTGSFDSPPDWREYARTLDLNPAAIDSLLGGLHTMVGERCSDIGLGEISGEQLALKSLASATGAMNRLHRVVHERAVASRAQARALEAIEQFAATGRPGQSLCDVMTEVARSFTRFATTAAGTDTGAAPGTFCAVIHQSGDGQVWSLGVFDQTADTLDLTASLRPPMNAQGLPIDLATADGELDSAAAILDWLRTNCPAAATADEMNPLRLIPLASPMGLSSALIHQHDLPGTLQKPGSGLDALRRVWARALAGAQAHDGSRKLAEALAHNTRMLAEAQQQLAQAQSMARLGELAAGAAHEMNNPLTIISGKAQIWLKRFNDGRDKADAQAVALAAAKLTDLVSSMHLIARPGEPNRVGVRVGEILSTLARQMRSTATSQSGTPEITVDASIVREPVFVDAKLFARAVGEVIANALQAEPKSGVKIRARIDDDEALVIEVADDGAGMSEHVLHHAMDPFFSSKKSGRRSGLGLSVARSVIQSHGGEITLISKPNKGTTATIRLPRWRESDFARSAKAA